MIKAVTVSDLSDVLLMAVGGVIGVVLSMFIHPKVLNYYKKAVKSA